MARGFLNNREKILVYLSQYSNLSDDFIAPKAITQEGIGNAIGIGRNNVPREMKKLIDEGFVLSRKLHVNGIRNKRTVYFLTSEGIERAKKIKDELKEVYVNVIEPSGDKKVLPLKNVPQIYGLNFITCLISLDKKKNIDLSTIAKMKNGIVHMIDEDMVLKEFYGRVMELGEIEKWFKSGRRILLLTGIAGIGKTSLLLKFVKENAKNRNVLFVKIESWKSVESLIYKMADFFSKIGVAKIERYLRGVYLSEERKIDWNNVALLIKESLKDEILIFDNVENSDLETLKFLRKIVEMVNTKENVKLILSGTKIGDIVPTSHLEYVKEIKLGEMTEKDAINMLVQSGIDANKARSLVSKYGGNPLILKIAKNQDYGIVRKFVYEGIIKNLSLEEREVLEFISVLRRDFKIDLLLLNDFEYFTIFSLVNKSIILEMEYERFTVHRTIKNFIYEHLTEKKRMKYHLMAARYYETNDVLEAVYHYTKAGRLMKANMLLSESYEKHLFDSAGEIRHLAMDLLDCYSETSEDREWNLYGIIGDTYRISGRWDEALENYKMAKLLSAKKDVDFYARMSVNISEILGKKGRYDEAVEVLKAVFKLITQIHDKRTMARAYYIFGIISMKIGELEDAKRYMKEAMKMGEKVLDTKSIGYAYNGLGLIERESGNYKEAIDYFEKARDYLEDCGDLLGVAKSIRNIGLVYYDLQDDKGEKYYKETIRIVERIGDKWDLGHTHLLMAAWYMFKKRLFKAKKYLEESRKIFEELDALEELSYVYNSLGTFYAYLGDGDMGKEFFDKAINLAAKIGNERAIIAISKDAAKYLKRYGEIYVEEYEKIAKGEKKVVAIMNV